MTKNFSKKILRDGLSFISIVGFLLFVVSTIACKVGLGEVVDAMAPTLSFTTPGSSSVLRDDIVISGGWTDDKGVREIHVSVIDTDTSAVIVEDDLAQVNEDGTWTYTILSKSSARAAESNSTVLVDGKYEVSIYAIDVGSHKSGTYSRTFEVDTEPPLVVLSKPNSLHIKDASTYGRKVQITGAVSDDHSVESLNIRVYRSRINENGEVVPNSKDPVDLPKSTFTNFDTSDMAVTIAQYWKEPPEDEEHRILYDNYVAIYGKDGDEGFDETKDFFIQISATDKSGNVSERVYAKSKLNSLIKQILADNGITNKTFEPNELKNILNGSYSNPNAIPDDVLAEIEDALRAREGTEYEDVLENGYISDNLIWLAFTVNSKANPNYALDYKYDNEIWSEINKELPVSINLTAGLDGYEIRPDTLKVTLTPVDKNMKSIADEKVPVVEVPLTNIYQNGQPLKTIDEDGNEDVKTTTVSSAKYVFYPKEFPELKAGVSYKIDVEGYDEEDLDLYPLDDNIYGFKIQLTESIPEISAEFTDVESEDEKEVSGGEYKKAADYSDDEDNIINFIVTDDDDLPMSFKASMYVASSRLTYNAIKTTLEKEPTLLEVIPGFENITLDEDNKKYRITNENNSDGTAYKIPVPVGIPLDSATANYTIVLNIDVEKDETKTNKIFYFYADNHAPTYLFSNAELKSWDEKSDLLITDEESTMILDTDSESKTYGLYTYTVNGTWSDEFGSGTKYIWWSTESDNKADTGKWVHVSDDVAIQSNPGAEKATSWSSSFPLYHLEGKEKTIYFYFEDKVGNQTPVIKYDKIVLDYSNPKISSGSLNEYNGKDSSNLNIVFTAEDTNEIEDIEYVITKNGTPLTTDDLKKSEDDENKIEIIKSEVKSIDLAENEWKTAGYEYKVNKTTKMTLTVSIPRNGTCDGVYEIKATAKDTVGRKSTAISKSTIIDCGKPVFDDNLTIASKNYNADLYFNSSILKVAGSYTEDVSGMDALYYYVKTSDSTRTTVPALDEKDSAGKALWKEESFKTGSNSFSITLDTLKDNTSDTNGNTLYICAKDIAGNVSDIKDFTINIDRTKPSSEYKYRIDDDTLGEVKQYFGKNDVTSTDELGFAASSIEVIVMSEDDIRIDGEDGWEYFIVERKNPDGTTFTIDSEDSYNGLFFPLDDQEYGVSISCFVGMDRKTLASSVIVKTDGSGDGEYTIRARARDDAGNTSDEIKFSFIVDGTAPVFNNDFKVANNTNYTDENYYYQNSTFKISGNYTENGTGIDSFYYYVAAPNATSAVTATTTDLSQITGVVEVPARSGNTNTALSTSIENLSDNVNGQYSTIYIQAKDNAGNLSAIKQFAINIDTVAPVLSSTALNEYYTDSETASVTLTATDENQIDDIEFAIYKNDASAPIASTAYDVNGITVTSTPVTRTTGENSLSTKTVTIAFSTNSTYDGKYTIKARAKDKAGKYSSATPIALTTTIDRVAPVAGTLKVGNATWSESAYYKDTTLKMTAEFTDNASGMDTLYYYVQYPGRSGTAPTANDDLSAQGKHDGDPISFKTSSNEVSFTAENYLENTSVPNKIYLQAFDKAGNKSAVTSYTINIDTSAPELATVLYRIYVDGTSFQNASGTAYVNGEDGIAVYGTYKDEQSGVGELTFTLGGQTLTPEDIQYTTSVVTSSITISEAQEIVWRPYNQIADKRSIRSWRVIFTPAENANGLFAVTGYNGTYVEGANGGKTAINSFTFALDNTAPVLNNLRLMVDADNEAYSKTFAPVSGSSATETTAYYINNANNTNLTISGVSTDNTGLDTVSLSILNASGADSGISVNNSGTSAVWKFEGINLSTLSNKATARITVTDIAGNSKSEDMEIRFDTTAPQSVHALDAKNKDLYFRIGENDNDDITSTTASSFYADDENHTQLAWNTEKDTNVGGKYSEGTYGNASTIKIRGNFGDGITANDSGVKMIYYKVFDHDPTEAEENAVIALTDITGYFAPLTSVQTKRVFYNVAPKGTDESDSDFAQRTFGGTCLMKLEGTQYVPVTSGSNYKYFKDIDITYDSTISGLNNGNNFIVVVAQDNVGNVGVSSVTIDMPDEEGNIVPTTYRKLTLNVDTVAPTITEITESDFDKNYVVNTQGKGSDGNLLTISGKVKDDRAGIKSFKVKLNETYLSASNITYDSNNSSTFSVDDAEHTWYATIPASVINAQTGAINVYAEAIDNAGTGQSVSKKIASIQIDSTAPSIVVTSSGGWVKNAIENVTVKVNDTNGIKKNSSNNEFVEYQVYASSDTSYANSLANGTANVGSDGTATVASINTSNENVFANGGSYIVRFTVKDIVGNTGYENSSLYKVDRTAPVLNDDNGDENPATGSGVGGVTTISAVAAKWFDATTLAVSGNFTDAAGSLTTGSGVKTVYYSLNPSSSAPVTGSWSTMDGSYAGNISGFVSGSNTLNIWAEDNQGNTSTPVSYTVKVDMTSPTITSSHTGTNAIIYANGSNSITVSGTVSDGTASTGAGVKDVKVKVGNNETLINATKTNGTDWTGGWTATIPTSYLTEGTLPVQATATDNAGEQGNSSTISVATINIDQTPPVIKIAAPDDADTDTTGIQVNKQIVLTGTATDFNGIDEIVGLYYQIAGSNNACPLMPATNSDATQSGWIPIDCTITGTNSWTASGINTALLAGTDGEAITDGSSVYIIAAAKDKAGNIGYTQPAAENGECGLLNVIVNQDTDRPVITFTNIEFGSGNNPSWIKRSSILYGRVDDDDGYTDGENQLTLEYSKRLAGTENWSDWATITVSGSGLFQLDLGDGSYNMLFRVKDVKDTTFALSQTPANVLLTPKLVDNKTTPETKTTGTPFNLAIDKTDPMYGSLAYYYYDTTAANGTGAYSATSSNTLRKLGGKYTKFKMTLSAGDENDVESVKLKFNSTLEFAGTASTTVTTQNGKKYRTWTINDIDITSLPDAVNALDGTAHNASLTIKDKAGLEVSTTVTVEVDNSDPEVSISQPSSTSLQSGGAEIFVQGSVAGSPEKLYFAISADGEHSPDATDAVTTWTGESITAGTVATDHNAKTQYVQLTDYDLGLSWGIAFPRGAGENTPATKSFNEYLEDFGITNHTAITENTFQSIVYLYVWIKAVDEVGNVSETCHKIQVDPQGDKPTVAFTSPTENNKSIGGTFHLQGTAIDPDGQDKAINSVWVQIKSTTHIVEDEDGNLSAENLSTDEYATKYNSAPSYNSETNAITMNLTKADLHYLVSKGYSVYNMNTYTSSSTALTVGQVDGEGDDDISNYEINDYAILATLDGDTPHNLNWYLDINANNEFNPTSGTNGLAVRVYARDGDHKISIKQERFLKFDADSPIITNLKLVKSTDAALETDSTDTKTYTKDMYLKGEWYLTGTVSDKDGISKLTIGNVVYIDNHSIVSAYESQITQTTIAENQGGGESVNFKVALPYYDIGSIDLEISAEDNASGTKHTGKEQITIRCDNAVPDIATTAAGGFNIPSAIQQNNSWYTFRSIAKEEAGQDGTAQSGFAYTAFYFVRNNTVANTKTLYDVLKARSDAAINITGDKFYTSSTGETGADIVPLGAEATDAANNTIVFANGLYWYRKNVAISNGVITTEMTGVRKNALVRIKDDFYLITDLPSNNTAKLDGLPADTTGSNTTAAYVAIAGIIDNTITEGAGGTMQDDGYYSAPSRDDGDRMIESVIKTGTSWEWEASICSRNIPDGPVSLCYVVFDKVGNHTTLQQVSGTVSNNAPRIAGFTISTDYDDDNQPDETKSTYAAATYSASSVTTAASGSSGAVYDPDKNSLSDNTKHALPTSISIGTAENPVMTVRGLTTIQPEIVGGNGAIYYSFDAHNQVTTGEGDEATTTTYNLSGNNSTTPIITEGSIDYTINESAPINIQLGDLLKLHDTEAGIPFKFTFWDSTDGLTKFSNSQKAEITTYLAINAQVNNDPIVKIKPFYWNSSSSNSLYQNSTANGHIELEADWLNASGYDSTATSGQYDKDPKVSGKIVIEGTAHDDKQISTIKAYIFDTETETELATYSNGALTSSAAENAFGTNNYWFEVISDEVTADGHDVEWKLYINTAKLLPENAVAGTDKTITVIATNKGTPQDPTNTSGTLTSIDGTTKYQATPNYGSSKSNTPGTTQTGSTQDASGNAIQTAYYKMDIVPYITKIQTTKRQKSGLKDNNIRSASGKYSIMYAKNTSAATYAADFITVKGFNLNPGADDVRIVNEETKATRTVTSGTNGSGTKVTRSAANADRTSFTASNVISKSGYLEVFTNGVRSLNNINNNNSYGTAKNSANQQLTATNATVSDYANAYNREPDYYTTKNVQLTDDRYIRVFDMKDTGKKNGYYPNMIMDGDDPVFGFVDLNGTADTSYGIEQLRNRYQPQRAKFSGTAGTQSSIEYLIGGGSSWSDMVMVKDSANKYIHAVVDNATGSGLGVIYNSYAGDYQWRYYNNNAYSRIKGAWGWGSTAFNVMYDDNQNAAIQFASNSGNNAIALETVNYDTGLLMGRYQNIKMVAKGNSTTTDGARFYMAYFDDNTSSKDVIFRTFQIKRTTSNGWNQLKDTINGNAIKTNLTEDNTSGRIVARPSGTSYKGSKYLDIGVTSENVVVIVYYDMEEGKLRMMYSANAITGSSITPTPNWTAANVTFPSYVGTDVSMVIDDSNGIHITASDSTDSDLIYMYMPSYNSSVLKTLRVDQAFSVGTWTSIKVKGNAADGYIPYIAYYNATETGSRDSIKLAYFADSDNMISTITQNQNNLQGVDSEGYTTGKWEYMTVPTITPPQGGDTKFRAVCLDFDSSGDPVVGYLATNLEFGKQLGE